MKEILPQFPYHDTQIRYSLIFQQGEETNGNLMMFNGGSWEKTFEKFFIRCLTFASLPGYFKELLFIKISTILKMKYISLAMKGKKTKNKVRNPQKSLPVWMKLKAV